MILYHESNNVYEWPSEVLASRARLTTERHDNGQWGVWCSISRPDRPLFGRHCYEARIENDANVVEVGIDLIKRWSDEDRVAQIRDHLMNLDVSVLAIRESDGHVYQAVIIDFASIEKWTLLK